MQYCEGDTASDEEINTLIDEMLAEDEYERVRKNSSNTDNDLFNHVEEQISKPKHCFKKFEIKHNGVMKSKRFSLFVMEAMRALQRQKGAKQSCPSKFMTTCEIINYIKTNYPWDGDIESQVRTALNRTCSQGFVRNVGKEKYRFIGPFPGKLVNDNNINLMNWTSDFKNNQHCCAVKSLNPTQLNDELNFQKMADLGVDSYYDAEENINNLNPTGCSRNFDKRKQSSRQNNKFQSCSRPRRMSTSCSGSRGGRSDTVGYVDNPIRDTEYCIGQRRNVNLQEPGLEKYTNKACGIEAVHTTETDEDVLDDHSDDSAFQMLRKKIHGLTDDKREYDLKRWIHNCRLECAKQYDKTSKTAMMDSVHK